ncbi:MAG: hypothetical protein OXR73_25255 [Myxococcales bacterium]|nr:hypothetical protein [Myxococcales bacterium]
MGESGVLCSDHEHYVERRLRFRRFRPEEFEEVRQQVYLALVEAGASGVHPGAPFEFWLRDLVRRPTRTFIDRKRRQRARFVVLGDTEPRELGGGLEHELALRERARRGGGALAEARAAYVAAAPSSDYDRGRFFDVVVLEMGAMGRNLDSEDYVRLAGLFPPTARVAKPPMKGTSDPRGYLRVRVNALRKQVQARLADVVYDVETDGRGGRASGTPD